VVALVNPQDLNPQPQPSTVFTELCSVWFGVQNWRMPWSNADARSIWPARRNLICDPCLIWSRWSTIADLVPLTGENRILVSAGLQRLNATQRPGLVALKRWRNAPSQLGTYEVGFQLGPRLNAAGRLETAEESLQLLLARDLVGAMPLAQNLDSRNHERQKMSAASLKKSLVLFKSKFDPQTDFVIVEGQLLWHIGVVGIVASRVLPAIFIVPRSFSAEKAANGAVRAAALRDLIWPPRCANAAICSFGTAVTRWRRDWPFNRKKLTCCGSGLNELARRALKPEDLQPLLRLDAEVGLDEMTLESLGELACLKPTGRGIHRCNFCARQRLSPASTSTHRRGQAARKKCG